MPATVSSAPIRRAVAFIAARVAGTPPAARDSALAASLPDCMTSASNSSDTGYWPPATSPTRLPSICSSSVVPSTTRAGSSSGARVSSVRVFSVLAG
ncbi:hypothetical protein SAMN05660199_01821 [Klenkia soli]|uniref:Uncharacterized protein n=1 Tax=Klenkia soli TaxID=1052260 RepID=A0A1H0IZH0_9ACTN|nr:hypothetical protein SAMN05660199_01821 [Klenkia soli]